MIIFIRDYFNSEVKILLRNLFYAFVPLVIIVPLGIFVENIANSYFFIIPYVLRCTLTHICLASKICGGTCYTHDRTLILCGSTCFTQLSDPNPMFADTHNMPQKAP